NNVTVIGASNYTAWASVSVNTQPIGCLYDDDTATLFVSSYGSNAVDFVGGYNLTDWTDTTGFNGPTVVATSSVAHVAYVSDYDSGYVSAFSHKSRLIVWSTEVGGHPYGIGFDTATAQIYAANIAGYVSVLSTSGTLVATIPTGTYTIGIHAYDPLDGFILADNYGSDNVTFISDGTGGTNPHLTPAAPTDAYAFASNMTTILLIWSNPSGIVTDNGVFVFSNGTCAGIATEVIDLDGVYTYSYVTHLKNATLYSFFVEAANSNGPSPPSGCTNATTEGGSGGGGGGGGGGGAVTPSLQTTVLLVALAAFALVAVVVLFSRSSRGKEDLQP